VFKLFSYKLFVTCSVRNRLQELEKTSLEIAEKSSHSLQHSSLKMLSPPPRVQEAKATHHPTRSASVATATPQKQHSISPGPTTGTTPEPRRRIPRPVSIRQPKLIGKSVEGAAMQAVAASRKRASSNQFKNASSVASARRSTLQVPNKEGGSGSVSKLAVTGSDGGPTRAGRPPAGTRRTKEKEKDDEDSSRIKADFKLVAQQNAWKSRRQSGLQRDSVVLLSNLWWPRRQAQLIPLALAEFFISKSPMAWCDACLFPPFPSNLDNSFVPIFGRWIAAFAQNVGILSTNSAGAGAPKADESIHLASTIKNVRGIKSLAVVKISKTSGKRAATVIRWQGWIVRLPRRTRRDHLKKRDANVISTPMMEKDATGLDKLASDLHVSQGTTERLLRSFL
jgi:hypothetical protein